MLKITLLCLASIIGLAFGQVPFFQQCPAVDVVQNFDVNRYLGLWYEQEKYPFLFELGGKCITATYGLLADGNVSVLNQQKSIFTNKDTSITGTARIVSPGKLAVSFNGIPSNRESNYWVVGTDYDNFAIVYSCSNVLFFSKRVVWILTRQRAPSASVIEAAKAIMASKNLSQRYLTTTNQIDC